MPAGTPERRLARSLALTAATFLLALSTACTDPAPPPADEGGSTPAHHSGQHHPSGAPHTEPGHHTTTPPSTHPTSCAPGLLC